MNALYSFGESEAFAAPPDARCSRVRCLIQAQSDNKLIYLKLAWSATP
jgi:hypothetical protein